MRDPLPLSFRPVLRRPALFAAVVAGACAAACVSPPDDAIGSKQGAALDICATAPEGALCDDKNVCTIFDVCKAGICKGSAAPNGTLCTDGNVCTANDSCRLGVCAGDPVPDATPCTDGDPCTVGDACRTGACLPGAGMLACNDGVACTLDICVAGLGCLFSPVGDCSVPKDAGPEVADASDARSDGDAADAPMMSGGDGAIDKADGTAGMDVMSADAPKETSANDTGVAETPSPVDAPSESGGGEAGGTDAGAGVDGGVDAAADGAAGGDAQGDAAVEEDADADAALDAAAVDAAKDAPADTPADVSTIPILRASGGACACATAEAPGGWGLALTALGVVVLARRRKTGGSRQGR